MTASPSPRYDPVADWYVEVADGWGADPAFDSLPSDLSGQHVLDLACGHGRVARGLARCGASVTGVDLAGRLVEHAVAIEARDRLGIRYLHGDVTKLDWWDQVPFDGVVCGMALMDIDDLDGAMATVGQVLVAGGWFVFSIVHPCYPGGPIGSVNGLPSWPPEHGYDREGWWTTEAEGIRGRVGANHRRLSTYLNTAIEAGLRIEQVKEPPAPVPLRLVVHCRRATSESGHAGRRGAARGPFGGRGRA